MLTAVLARQAAAAVGVRTCWPWESAATLLSARRRKALRRPRGMRGAGHTVAAARLQLVLGFNSGYKITTHKQRFGHVNVTNRTSSEISYIKKTKIRTFDLMFLGLKKTKKI